MNDKKKNIPRFQNQYWSHYEISESRKQSRSHLRYQIFRFRDRGINLISKFSTIIFHIFNV